MYSLGGDLLSSYRSSVTMGSWGHGSKGDFLPLTDPGMGTEVLRDYGSGPRVLCSYRHFQTYIQVSVNVQESEGFSFLLHFFHYYYHFCFRYVYGYFICLMSGQHLCTLFLQRPEEGTESPGTGVTDGASMWVLAIECGSSGGAAGALN